MHGATDVDGVARLLRLRASEYDGERLRNWYHELNCIVSENPRGSTAWLTAHGVRRGLMCAMGKTCRSETVPLNRLGLREEVSGPLVQTIGDATPIVVDRFPDGRLVVADGHHRFAIAQRNGEDTIEAVIVDVTEDEDE